MGVSYEYPEDYQKKKFIGSGDRFVYHEPRLGYTGCGVVGRISASAEPGNLICEVLNPVMFETPVPLRGPDGVYYEADPAIGKHNVYWAQGVRPIGEGQYESILRASSVAAETVGASYGSPGTTVEVDKIAVQAALEHARREFPGYELQVMPHNNPGFDIRVGPADEVYRFVEVKGTQSGSPAFFLSEGERAFSHRESHRYTLMVITGIDLKVGGHRTIYSHVGQLDGASVELVAAQWKGRLIVGGKDAGA
jgi:hypothetical protein